MILNTDIEPPHTSSNSLSAAIRCDLHKLERCEFVKWCRQNPLAVSEPLWWALITNLAHLEGGTELIHEVSRLDTVRYAYADTQRKIQKAIDAGYRPVSCKTLISEAMMRPGRGRFQCSKVNHCLAKAPMYMAVSHAIYAR
jgi:putative DNA primase/helicase